MLLDKIENDSLEGMIYDSADLFIFSYQSIVPCIDEVESVHKEIAAMDLMESSIPKIFGSKSDKLQSSLMKGR